MVDDVAPLEEILLAADPLQVTADELVAIGDHLDAVRAEMKAAFGTVPAELVNAWRAREKELRA